MAAIGTTALAPDAFAVFLLHVLECLIRFINQKFIAAVQLG